MSSIHLLAATAVLVASLVPARADAQLLAQQDQSLTATDGTTFVVTSGTVRVPELRSGSRGASGTIDLAFVRVRRTGAPGRSAHIMLAGGPGDSGVSLALGMARQGGAMLSDLMAGDLIGIDQRGTGKSLPNLASSVVYGLPLDRAGSPELWQPLMERASRDIADELTRRGIRLEAYNTRESADDVDDVRRALGYAKVTLWGRSYGSHLALATLRRHEDAIERVVLVSPEGPNHAWKLPSQVDVVLQRLSERARMPDLLARMRQVIERLSGSPVTVALTHPLTGQPATVTIGAFDVQWITANALGDPRALATLPATYREMAEGDFRRVAQVALARRARLGVESAMKHVMDLSSGATPDRRARIERESATAVLGNAINFPGMYLGAAWGAPDLGDDFRRPVTSTVPTLIIAGDLDPRTPVENAREIAAALPNGQVLVIENATHQFDLFGSAPIRLLLGRFLRGDRLVGERVTLPPILFQHP